MVAIDPKTLELASRNWQTACRKLGVRAFAPSAAGDLPLGCLAFLPDFGGPNGMLVGAMDLPGVKPSGPLEHFAKQKGLFCSFVNASGFATGNVAEAVFIDALQDWGYYGPADKCPAWFKGYIGGDGLRT